MQPYRPLSACSLLDGVSELERFFDNYKHEIIEMIRGIGISQSRNQSNFIAPTSTDRAAIGNSPSSGQQEQREDEFGDNDDDHRHARSSASLPSMMQESQIRHSFSHQQQQQQQRPTSAASTTHTGTTHATVTSRLLFQQQQQQQQLKVWHHISQSESQALTDKLFGSEHGVLDIILHLFTRHGTSHELLDAIEHLNLLIPNWHEPRKNDDGSLMETAEMRMYARRNFFIGTGNEHGEEDEGDNEVAEKNNSSKNKNSPQQKRQKHGPSKVDDEDEKDEEEEWHKSYTIADICHLTGLTNDPTVVRLLERDRGFGTKLWKLQQPLDQDGAPPRETRPGFGDPQTKKPFGWRSRLKFAASLRAIHDRPFVTPEAREAIRHLEQIELPGCSFQPHDLVAMSNAMTTKLELDAERATRDDMIADLRQQVRAIESFVRSLENDQVHFSEDGEMALLKSAAIQQIEWYERLLRAMESQFDVACDDIQSAEQARKERNWAIFRQAKGDLPCVQGKVKARIGRLQSAAGKIRDYIRARAFRYEADVKSLDEEIVRSTNNCTNHLQSLVDTWGELVDAIKKAAAAEGKLNQLGASLRCTVEDRLNLLGARAMKDDAHSSLLKSSNDVLLDLAEEMGRLNNSNSFLSQLHGIVCSGSDNITEQYDRRREELLRQAEKIHQDHERWLHEYSVALGRHRHRVSSKLSEAKETEKKAEMRRELAADLLDFQARAYAQYRDEAATDKIRVKSELAALDGGFHARNEEFRKRALQLNQLKDFVEDLIMRQQQQQQQQQTQLIFPGDGQEKETKKNIYAAVDFGERPKDPSSDQTSINLVNLTSQHHLEKNIRNKFEVAGRSKQEQTMREVLWEKGSIHQAKEASRVARRVPLPTTSAASSPPPFLSPAPPKLPASTPPCSTWSSNNNYFSQEKKASEEVKSDFSSVRPRTAQFLSKSNNSNNNNNNNNNNENMARPQTAATARSRLGQRVSVGQVMRVVFPFQPRVDDELKLERGDTVIVLRHGEDAGWAFGVSHDKMGQFPLNYVEAVPS